jgi:hypothetical protein
LHRRIVVLVQTSETEDDGRGLVLQLDRMDPGPGVAAREGDRQCISNSVSPLYYQLIEHEVKVLNQG